MKSKSIVLLAVSLGFGLIAAFGISQVLGRGGQVANVPREEMVKVYVAAKPLNMKDELIEENVELKEFPISLVPEGAVESLEGMDTKLIRTDVIKGGIVTDAHLIDRSEINEIAIPPGHTVISIPVDDTVDGLLIPGDLVDLMGIFQTQGATTPFVRTFLKNVKVYSVNSETVAGPERNNGGASRVSVLVTKKQSEKIILAQRLGSIRLRLVAEPGEDEVAGDETGDETDIESLFGSSASDPSKLEQQFIQRSQSQPSGLNLNNLISSAGSMLNQPENEFVTVIHTPAGPMEYVFNDDNSLPTLKGDTPSMQGLPNMPAMPLPGTAPPAGGAGQAPAGVSSADGANPAGSASPASVEPEDEFDE